jgi:hypothetical protein
MLARPGAKDGNRVRSGLAAVLVLVAVALAAFAVAGHMRARSLEKAATLRALRSAEAGQAFSTTFAGSEQDSELKLLDERRALMRDASAWNRGSLLAFGLFLLALFAAWLARELRAYRDALLAETPQPRKPGS